MAGRAFVVAHLDPAGRVALHLRALAAHLASLGRVVFVSTNLAEGDAHALRSTGIEVITRPNIGYDFFSYKSGIEALGDLAQLDAVTILNSSFVCLDPPTLVARFLSSLGPGVDVMGITSNYEYAAHVQSYWMSFETRRVLDSPAFASFWRDMQPVSEREQVIPRYEVGLSQAMNRAGLRLASAFKPPAGARAPYHNPTHVFWDAVLAQFGIIKLELLKSNPFRMDLSRLDTVLQARPDWRALVDDALAAP